ncbi:MAG: thymidylate synthase [Anaerolineaceae bacterium]|nr:thymidylate synthase [Anaerolineaceae bacterium]
MYILQGNSADEIWQNSFNKIIEETRYRAQAGRGGSTRELLHCLLQIQDPRQRWVLSRQPAMNPAFAIAEVLWILAGKNDAKFLNYWNTQLPSFSGEGEYYHGSYGYRLRNNLGFDQLERAFLALSNNPDCRQVVLQFWDGRIDFPNEDGSPVDPDIPCNIVSLLKIRNNKLEWAQIMRSNDLFLGLPHNIVQFTTLQEIMAGWLGVEIGTYIHFSDSLHLYQKQLDHGIGIEPVIVPKNSDSLVLSKSEFDQVFIDLLKWSTELTKNALTKEQLMIIPNQLNIPQAWQNLWIILGEEAARRRKWSDLQGSMVKKCTNPLLVQAWHRWFTRMSPKGSDIL